MQGSIVRSTVQISILGLLTFLKVIFFHLFQFGSQDVVPSFSVVHTMGLARLHFFLCLSVTENTITCAYTVDTSTNGQGKWISVCIAGGEEGRGPWRQKVAAGCCLWVRKAGWGGVNVRREGYPICTLFIHHLEMIYSFYNHNYYVIVSHINCAFSPRSWRPWPLLQNPLCSDSKAISQCHHLFEGHTSKRYRLSNEEKTW